MKRKKLMALMLAAAMAVTSLTIPGGVGEVETVYAEAKYGKSDITNIAYDATTNTLTASVPSGAESLVQYAVDGISWTNRGLTAGDGTVSIKVPAGSYENVWLRFSDNTDETAAYGKAITVGEDLSKIGDTITAKLGDTALTEGYEFTATGESVLKAANVKLCKGEVDLDATAYSVALYKGTKDSANIVTDAIEVGEYVLSIYPNAMEPDNYVCYNTKDITFKVVKGTLSEEKIKAAFTYTAPKNLVYNGKDQSGVVRDAITPTEDVEKYAVSFSFKKDGNEYRKLVDAGTYDVYIKVSDDASEGAAKLGEVTVAKYQPVIGDFEVLDKEVTYDGEVQSAEIASCSALLTKGKVTFIYKYGDTQTIEPINAGTYKIFVRYEGDVNCAQMAEVDTGKTLTINKKTESRTTNAQVVKVNAGSVEVDLTSLVGDYAKNDADVTAEYINGVYIADSSYVVDTAKLTFTLNEAGKKLTTVTDTAITLDLSKVFRNYNTTVTIPITIVPENTTIVDVGLNNSVFTYDGTEKKLSYSVSASEGTSLPSGFTESVVPETKEITKDGKKVDVIKGAGTYTVTAELSRTLDGVAYYGKLVQEVTVNPATMTDATKYFGLEGTPLTYDGKSNYASAIVGKIKVSGSGIEAADYDVDFTGHIVANGVSQAGTVTVKIKMRSGNYTSDWLTLGEVEILPASAEKFTVTDDGKGNLTVKFGDAEITDVVIAYFAKGGETALADKPTEDGEYTAKIQATSANFASGTAKEYNYTIGSKSDSGSGSGSSSGSSSNYPVYPSGNATTSDTTKTDTSKNNTTTTTSGTEVTSTEEKNADGTSTVTKELKNEKTGVTATVKVEKDAAGTVTGVTAKVVEESESEDDETTISASMIAELLEAAGTDDVKVTVKTNDSRGYFVRTVTVNAADLTPGNKLRIIRVNKVTGKKSLENAATYEVGEDGSLVIEDTREGHFEVVTNAEVKALTKEVLKTIKVTKSKANVTKGEKTAIKLAKGLNKKNVLKITYTSGKKSIATVNREGKITAKKAGTVTIKATVTLRTGKTKTVSMKVNVKAGK